MALISKLKNKKNINKKQTNKWLKNWLSKKVNQEIANMVQENSKRLKQEREEWVKSVLGGNVSTAFKELSPVVVVPTSSPKKGNVKSYGISGNKIKKVKYKTSKYLSTFTPKIDSKSTPLLGSSNKYLSKYDPSKQIELSPEQLNQFKRDIAWSLPSNVITAFKYYMDKAQDYFNTHPEIHSYYEDFEEWYYYIMMY